MVLCITHYSVCPTCVGMNRKLKMLANMLVSMLHVRGDEPLARAVQNSEGGYAPRAWG